MEISDILFSKLRGRELISVIVWSFAFGTILFSPLICAQETTKASVGVMLEGVTPMGEIRVELPPGTDFTVMERERDTLKLRKGPFCGSVPFAKTELWRPPPTLSPTATPVSISISPRAENESQDHPLFRMLGGFAANIRTHPSDGIFPMAVAAGALAMLILVLKVYIGSMSGRRAHRERILRHELKLARTDLKELNVLLEGERNRFLKMERDLQGANSEKSPPQRSEVSPENGSAPLKSETPRPITKTDERGIQALDLAEQRASELERNLASLKTDNDQLGQQNQDLRSRIDSLTRQMEKMNSQQENGVRAQCPHCSAPVLLSSLRAGTNICAECGGEFLCD